MIRRSLALAALAAVLLLIGTAPVAAQQGNTTAPNGTAVDSERIDATTVLVSSDYDAETDMASVTIRSERPQQITVTDAGATFQGGEIPQRSVMVKPGETTTLKIPVTEVRGWTGVTVATSQTLYAVPISGMDTSTLAFLDNLTPRTALVWGAISMVVWMVLGGIYVLWIEGGEPEVA